MGPAGHGPGRLHWLCLPTEFAARMRSWLSSPSNEANRHHRKAYHMMKHIRRGTSALLTAGLLTGTVVIGSTGSAEALTTVPCGAVITANVTLAADVGPCTGDGIRVAADGVKVNLNGFTINGRNSRNETTTDQIGVRLTGVRNVVVQGPGVVKNFDAGVAIDGGQANTVKGLTVRNNVAHVLLTANGLDPASETFEDDLYSQPCDYGDGISVYNSKFNTITGNTATDNGPYSGISLVGMSSNNTVSNNRAVNNLVPNEVVAEGVEPGTAGPCGPFSGGPTGEGRLNQAIGIRVEGPGATNNTVQNNTANGNLLEGITVHGNICPVNPIGLPGGTPPNNGNLIKGNTANANGFADGTSGISVLSQGPGGTVCVASNTTIEGNTSNGNAAHGIFVGGRGSENTKVIGNTVNNNGFNGVSLAGPSGSPGGPLPGAINSTIIGNRGRGNGDYDGFDGNPMCDNNRWRSNSFVVVNQPCIR